MEDTVELPTCHNCGFRDARLREFERCPMCRVVYVLDPSERPSSPIALYAAMHTAPAEPEPWWTIGVSSAVFIGLCYAGFSRFGYQRHRGFDVIDALILAAMIAYWRLRPSLSRLTGKFFRLLG